jgi:hypothetical protein
MRPMVKVGVAAAVLALATLALIVQSVRRQARVSCEVCIVFHERSQCRTAAGATREEATRTAIDTACALLASGMTDGIRCSNTPPARVTCSP